MEKELCVCGDANCTVPYRKCHCGCGQATKIRSQNHTKHGWKAGEPSLYIRFHRRNPRPFRDVLIQPDDPNIRYIPLTRGMFSIVDADDYDRLMQWSWIAQCKGKKGRKQRYYAVRGGPKGRNIYMHDEVLPNCITVDHKFQNTLDNRKSKLRPATQKQQTQNQGMLCTNTSGYKGVSHIKGTTKFSSYIDSDGDRIRLGRFSCPITAARVRDAAAVKLHGEFAWLNFPEEHGRPPRVP